MPDDTPPTWTILRSRIAGLSRDRAPDDPELLAAREALRLNRLEAYVLRAVTEPPALSAEQREHLALLLLRGARTTTDASASVGTVA